MGKTAKYIIGIAVAIVILLVAILIFKNFNGCNSMDPESPETKIIYDTSVVTRYESVLKHDTVIKWYEKILYKEVPAKEIYIQRVDSVFIERTKSFDVMLNVNKKGRDLTIYALNQDGKLLKEYHYKVGDDFTATSATNKLVVKTRKFYWTGLDLNAESYLKPKDIEPAFYKKMDYRLSLETGISYYDYASLKLGIERDFGTGENLIKFKTTIKLLQ